MELKSHLLNSDGDLHRRRIAHCSYARATRLIACATVSAARVFPAFDDRGALIRFGGRQRRVREMDVCRGGAAPRAKRTASSSMAWAAAT